MCDTCPGIIARLNISKCWLWINVKWNGDLDEVKEMNKRPQVHFIQITILHIILDTHPIWKLCACSHLHVLSVLIKRTSYTKTNINLLTFYIYMSLSYWPRYLLSILMWIGTGVVRCGCDQTLAASLRFGSVCDGGLELGSNDHFTCVLYQYLDILSSQSLKNILLCVVQKK